MLHRIDNSGNVVEVLQCGIAVFATVYIDNMYSCSGSAKIKPGATDVDIVLWVLRVESKPASAVGNGVFDKRARKVQATIFIGATACADCIDAGWNGLGQANILQYVHYRIVDLDDVTIRQRCKTAIRHTGQYRPLANVEWCVSLGAFCCSGTPACPFFLLGHIAELTR